MKIPHGLAQFEARRSLFVVTGATEAHFYSAHDGEIQKIKTFAIQKPHYSDREDFGGGGGPLVFEANTKNEAIKLMMHQEFIKQVKESLKEFSKENIDHVYIFCPSVVHHEIEAAVPKTLQKKLVRVWKGNYYKESPVRLLEKLKAAYQPSL